MVAVDVLVNEIQLVGAAPSHEADDAAGYPYDDKPF